MSKFLNNINLEAGNDIQFKTTAGANAGKIEQDGNNLVLSNAAGDVLLGDGSSDVYIGDGTNNVDILFEQSGSIKGDGSAITLTIGGANTTLNLENPNINGALSLGAASINNKLTFTTANGYILFDHEPSGDTGAYEGTTSVPLLKIDRGGSEKTILERISQEGGLLLGADDSVIIAAGDTRGTLRSNLNEAAETVIFASEAGFHAYGFPNNLTDWSNRNEFRFRSDSATASDNGLYIGDGSSTQFIDLSRNLKNIGTIGAGAITSTGSVTATSLIKSGGSSSEFLKADGSVDSNTYLTASSTQSKYLRSDANDTSTGSAAFGIGSIDPDSHASFAGGFGNISDGGGWGARGLFIHGGGTGDAAAIGHNGNKLYFGIQNGSATNSMDTWLQVSPARVIQFNGTGLEYNTNTVWHAGNDGTGTGLDADLLDGNHASAFATASHSHAASDITSGTLATARIPSLAASKITSGTLDNARLDNTIFRHRGTLDLTSSSGGNNSLPFDDAHTETRVAEYGTRALSYTGASATMLTINTGGSASVFQIGAHYNGNDFYMRTRTDSSNWQTWKKLWHAGNDGTGSGLDADTLDAQEGSYYRNASNLNAGTVAADRLSTASTQPPNDNSTKIATTAYVQTEITDLIGTAPAALDTLSELADAINDDASFSSTVTTALGNRLRVDTASQGLNATQKSNARTNLGLGSAAIQNTSAFMGASGMAANTDVYMNFRVLRNSNSTTANDGMYIGYGNSNNGQTRIFGGGSTGVHLAINATNMAFNNNAVWHAGNDGSGSGLDADLLDGNHAAAFATSAQGTKADNALPKAGGTMTGQLICPSASTTRPVLTGGFLSRNDNGDGDHDVHGLSERYYPSNTTTADAWGLQWNGTNNQYRFIGSGNVRLSIDLDGGNTDLKWNNNSVFHDGYHPNADTLTTARTITLAGDVTGNVSFNGSSDVSITTAVANDSHTHDGRYYTETETNGFLNLKANLNGATFTGTLNSRDIKFANGYHLQRSNHSSGHLEGSYNNVGANASKSNPIYTIGSSYNPTDTALSNMYGIGYNHTDASFISFTGASGWGQYVAADGDARIFLCGSNGVISSTGEHYVGSSVVWNAGNDGSGSGLDADLLDGMQSHTGRNNEANKVVRTDGNGYIQAGWINTTSGANTTQAINRVYASTDSYIRYYSAADFGAGIGQHISYNDLTNKPTIPSAYSLPEATATARGGIELFSNTDQSVAANSVSATSGRTYGIQLNSAGQAVVNVPWSDTNTDTNTTYTAGSGLTLSGTEFSHSDTSSQSSSANSGRTYIQSVNLDGQGHVTGLTTATETVVNTDTTYSVGDGGLTQKNFTTTLKNKLDGIAASANNYVLPTTISGTRNFSGLISANAGLRLGDNDKIQLGDSQDLEIAHYSVGQITNKTGDLYISSTAANTDIIFYAAIGATPTEFYRMNGGTGKNTFSRPVDISANLDVDGITTANAIRTDAASTSYSLITRNTAASNYVMYVQATQSGGTQKIATFGYGSGTAGQATEVFRIARGQINAYSSNLTVGGSITGNSKNFSIPHPTKEGKRLVHSCLEGPEIGVYFRGRSQSSTIEMPDYWGGLVDLDSMTVELTAIGPNQDLYVEDIADDGDVTVGSNTETALNYFYVVYGERKDMDKLEIEVDDTGEFEGGDGNSEEESEE